MRRSVLLLVTVLATGLVPSTAWGITYGQPDGGEHPQVAALVLQEGDGTAAVFRMLCSGTLVDTDTIVTAAHCAEIAASDYPEAEVRATFDAVLDDDGDDPSTTPDLVHPGAPLTGHLEWHERYGSSWAAKNPYDLAVFELDEPYFGAAPAALPTQGLLDDSDARWTTYTTVGYGVERTTNQAAHQVLSYYGFQRRSVEQTLRSVTGSWATFSSNQATGDGGTCYGDSGGPHFDEDGTVVAITVMGDPFCKSLDKAYRLDTPWALDFLADHVEQP